MKTIDVILGSARSNSSGAGIFNYLKKNAKELESDNGVKLNFMAIRDFDLPTFNEPLPPMGNPDRKLTGEPKKWIDNVKAGDGYLFIEPVYDNGLSGAFKNALDYIGFETADKPARIISYSSNAMAGQASALALLPTLAMLGMVMLPHMTMIGHIDDNFEKDGNFVSNAPSEDYYSKQLKDAVADIASYTKLLNK